MNASITMTPRLRAIIERLGSSLAGGVNYALAQTGGRVEAFMIEEAPVKSGNLQSSVHMYLTDNSAVVGASARTPEGDPYGLFVALGTRPHVIRARNRKALAWYGANHPVRQVNHPGTKPNPFHERAVERADVQATFTNALESFMRRSN